MLGHSKGATDVLLYAAQYDDVPCVVNLAARYELQQGVLQRLGPAVLQQLKEKGQVGCGCVCCAAAAESTWAGGMWLCLLCCSSWKKGGR
jgi:hypothetical protein